MELSVLGVNHKTAPLNIRELLSLTSKEQKNILNDIISHSDIQEGLVLSTCNRTEIYLVTDNIKLARNFSLEKFQEKSNLGPEKLKKYVYEFFNLEAVNHIFRVAAGLDSMVIGEFQILGQIKKAFKMAKDKNTVDSYLYKVFSESLRTGKKVRNETRINAGGTSISYVAVKLARDIFGKLSGETVLILGAGETGELTLKNLVEYGVKGVMVANRTYKNAQKLARKFQGGAVKWNKLSDWVNEVDIIIGSTAAPHYVLHQKQVKNAMEERKRPLFLIDIALPRDIEPEVKNIPEVHLYDIDDLKQMVEKNISERKDQVIQAENIIKETKKDFQHWLNTRQCTPIIREMRQRAGEIKNSEIERALNKLSNSENSPEKIINNMAHRLVNKVLHQPTEGIKQLSNSDNSKEKLKIAEKLLTNN